MAFYSVYSFTVFTVSFSFYSLYGFNGFCVFHGFCFFFFVFTLFATFSVFTFFLVLLQFLRSFQFLRFLLWLRFCGAFLRFLRFFPPGLQVCNSPSASPTTHDHVLLRHYVTAFPPKNAETHKMARNCIYIYMYIYIYAVELLSGPSLGVLEVIIWSKFVFSSKTPIAKNTIKIGVSAHFFGKKNCAQKFRSYYLVQVGVF